MDSAGTDPGRQRKAAKKYSGDNRSDFEDLSSRVQNLENILLVNAESSRNNTENVAVPIQAQYINASSNSAEEVSPPISSTILSTTRSYRGSTSPWSALTSRLESRADSQSLVSFRKDATRLADDERSSSSSVSTITYDVIHEFPQLQQDDVIRFVKVYATEAPYPILHYESLLQVTELLVYTRRASRWGQVVCVLMYMAFGSARVQNNESSVSPQLQSGTYLQQAFQLMPRLILEHDLWALKALTLIVHYLQASSEPEPCWALLGSASRLAISLGFHQKGRKVDAYSSIEMEEGKRAWWLCYIMEKTFCTTFGYPSLTFGSKELFDIGHPIAFEPTARASNISNQEMTLIDQNETEAKEFFGDMIDLAFSRDEAMKHNSQQDYSEDEITTLLRSTLRDELQGQFSPTSATTLRTNISDLAHYNAIQVIALQISPRSTLPIESLLSARASLQIILETKTAGTTMCLWMWLYYAFSSAVVLFLQSIATPLHPDTTLDLALLSDLHALCTSLAPNSEGAKRIMTMAGQMEKVAFEVVKRSARAKRAAEDEGFRESERVKMQKRAGGLPDKEAEGSTEGRGAEVVQSEQNPVWPTVDGVAGLEMLDGSPQTFQWDQWDQWLEDVPFDLE